MQLWIVSLLGLGALAWLLRGALKGSCAQGCAGCGKACPARTLQAHAVPVRPSSRAPQPPERR